MEQSALTLATYNIHSCVGTDGQYDPDRTIEVIRSLDADIIALQEVTSDYSDDLNLLKCLGERVCMEVIPGMTMFRETSGYGNAVLVRDTVDRMAHINISYKEREPRGAVSLMMTLSGKTIHLISTHLGLSRYERRKQAEHLLAAFRQNPADIDILMGDLNEWYFRSKPMQRLRTYFVHTRTPATFPAQFPALCLDRILVRPPESRQIIEAVKTPLTRLASDHLPVKARLVL